MPQSRRSLRPRISIACRRCNSKKVRCDAHAGQSCTRCSTQGVECVLIDSQRGKYERHPSRRSGSSVSKSDRPDKRSLQGNANIYNRPSSLQGCSPREGQRASKEDALQPLPGTSPDPMLFAQVAEQRVGSGQHLINKTTPTIFLGEAFSLTYVINDILAPFLSTTVNYQRRLHFPIDGEHARALYQDKRVLYREQRGMLRTKGILYELPSLHLTKLLRIYVSWFHPAFPVLEHTNFIQKVETEDVSLLILNAVLMIAVTICPAEDITMAGLPDRYASRRIFYEQAKALYDSDCDTDKMDLVAATLLLSFWWEGPSDPKDSWHWLGISASLAQSLGMHRTTKRSGMDTQTRRLWKKIWWSIRIREALLSASIGRPQHFSERDCDVEMLELDDVDGDHVQCQYVCQMARLCHILSEILTTRYAACMATDTGHKRDLEKALETFRRNIPPILHYGSVELDSQQGHWAAMLAIAASYATMLLCRPPSSMHGEDNGESWGNRARAVGAANEVSRIMEDLLTVSTSHLCQIHVIPALFNAMAIHVYVICTSNALDRELATNRARTCMLALSHLKELWPVGGWVFQVFRMVTGRLRKKIRNDGTTASSFRNPVDDLVLDMDNHPNYDADPGMVNNRLQGVGMPPNSYWSCPDVLPFPPSLFDFDPYQSHMENTMGFFDLLNLPAL